MIRLPIIAALLGLLTAPQVAAQAVDVTLTLDQSTVLVGQETTLRAFAQIVRELQPSTDRIFSWYVDLLNPNPDAGQLQPLTLARSASDQDPRTSSGGTVDGSNILGIYDTFIDLDAAGRDAPVELFSISIRAIQPGATTLQLRAGTSEPDLGPDFIVAPAGGGDPLLGADYSLAQVQLTVIESLPPVRLEIERAGSTITLSFPLVPGASHFVEFQDALDPAAPWQPLPNSPHNSGEATDQLNGSFRFYRLRMEP